MKRILVASILSIAATVASHAQGLIQFNTYVTGTQYVTYNQASTGLTGGLPTPSFTAAIYYALGDTSASVGADASHIADPSGLGGGLQLYTGAQATAPFASSTGFPGLINGGIISVPGYSAGLVTFVVVAYNGASYGASTIRGHSAAFTETPVLSPTPANPFANFVGFQVYSVPEPTTIALAGMGLASLLFIRRRK